jgi:hypothetical protein
MTKLASTTVGVGGSASVDFTNIPQGYTDLVIKVSGRTAAGQGACNLSFNSSTSNLNSKIIYGIGSGTPGSVSYSSVIRSGYIVGTDYTASVFSNNEIYITNYSSSTFKAVTIDSVTETNATEAYSMLASGLWSDPSPITSIILTVINNATGTASTFTQHSTFTLYGIKNARQTAGNSIKATGGNIVFDGTYVYHVFPTTGAFTPTQPILADALVVAGGGGGGYWNGGGGGAGGLLGYSNQSLIATSYTVTVGAGGNAGVSGTAATQGTNSQFSSLTASVGGGNGGADSTAGGSGGSGGGAGYGAAGGSATSGQGNAGGAGDTTGTPVHGGGGGGAGAAGSNGTTGQGVGGNGSSSYSSWGLATGQGENVSGTYYFAGGGTGGNQTNSNSILISGGYGGGGSSGYGYNATVVNPTAGKANTGGGGGGGTALNPGAAGGSGIVIIRYKG